MLQKKGAITRRRKKAAPPATEFDNPRKRKDFTVFLVEDDEPVRHAMRDVLVEEKIKVEDYMTAMEFYRDYRDARPGVLILDIRLPGMSGVELQEKLVKDKFALPVIMMCRWPFER